MINQTMTDLLSGHISIFSLALDMNNKSVFKGTLLLLVICFDFLRSELLNELSFLYELYQFLVVSALLAVLSIFLDSVLLFDMTSD